MGIHSVMPYDGNTTAPLNVFLAEWKACAVMVPPATALCKFRIFKNFGFSSPDF